MRHRSSRGGRLLEPMPGLVVPGRELRGPDGWEALFGRCAPFVVEIGFGKDTFLLDRAQSDPERDHIGVERDPHRVGRFLERAAERGLTNVRAMPVAAELALGVCLPGASVAELHVYFPDPWPKERHAHHRLVQPWFATAARRVLAPDGELFVATDDAPYCEQILDVLESGGFENVLGRHAWSPDPPHGHETRFERLWRGKGRDIRHMRFRPGTLGPWIASGARGDSPT